MKDYLSAIEKNQIIVLMLVLEAINGKSNSNMDEAKISAMVEDWKKRGNLTKEEHRALKSSSTYLKKFLDSVLDRLSEKERNVIKKRLLKVDFRPVDDYTIKKIFREMENRMVNAVVTRELFNKWCEEIMECNCKNCSKDWKDCELHEVFEENFVPESTWNLENCRYAYKKCGEGEKHGK